MSNDNLKKIRKDGHYIKNVTTRTRCEILTAVRKKGSALAFLKDEELNDEIVFNALRNNIRACRYIQDRYDLRRMKKYESKIFRKGNCKKNIFD